MTENYPQLEMLSLPIGTRIPLPPTLVCNLYDYLAIDEFGHFKVAQPGDIVFAQAIIKDRTRDAILVSPFKLGSPKIIEIQNKETKP